MSFISDIIDFILKIWYNNTKIGGYEMDLLMIQVWDSEEKLFRSKSSRLFTYTSLTLASLYSTIPKGTFKRIDIIDEHSQTVDYDRRRYDVVMISFDTSSAVTAYRHCREFRKRGAYVVCGGYHATALPQEAARYCDTVISGPAELTVPKFIRDYIAGVPKPFYRDTHVCAADFPVPSRDKVKDRNTLNIPAVIADRGCINACRYCSMASMWKSDPRSVESVINEIRSLHTKMLIFFDPNFFGKREYAMKLMKALKPLKILWVGNATADFGYDHELMQAAYDSGCRGVLIGFESLNEDSLKSVNKSFPKADKYRRLIKNIHSHGIAVNGSFVLGFDNDTEEQIRALPAFIDRLGLDLCRFAILTPYPGTAVYKQMEREGRLLTYNWRLYNQHHTVFRPKNLTPEKLDKLYRNAWKKAFSWKSIIRRVHGSPCKGITKLILLGANIGFRNMKIGKSEL